MATRKQSINLQLISRTIMKKFIERKHFSTRKPINKEAYPQVARCSTASSKRTEGLICRLAVPLTEPGEKPEVHRELQLLELVGLPREDRGKLHRELYIGHQTAAQLIKEECSRISAVIERNKIIYAQEKILPGLIRDIDTIKHETLPHSFIEKFYMPSVDFKNSLVSIAASRSRLWERVRWLGHCELQEEARLLGAAARWLGHVRARHVVHSLATPHGAAERLVGLPAPPAGLAVLPATRLSHIVTCFRRETAHNHVSEVPFESVEDLMRSIEQYEQRNQTKSKQTIFMEEKLDQQRKILQELKDKTEGVARALQGDIQNAEEQFLIVKNETNTLQIESKSLLEQTFWRGAQRASRLDVSVTVASLAAAVLRAHEAPLVSTLVTCAHLERHLQSLLDQLGRTLRPGDPPQERLETESIQQVHRELKHAQSARQSVLRMNKLERRLITALAPPFLKTTISAPPPFIKSKRKVKLIKAVVPSALIMETPYCFDRDVNMEVATKLYRPSPSLAAATAVENPLMTKSWVAVEDGECEVAEQEMSRPRKSTESVLELLESRSSYDFILTTGSRQEGDVIRQDVGMLSAGGEDESEDESTSSESQVQEEEYSYF